MVITKITSIITLMGIFALMPNLAAAQGNQNGANPVVFPISPTTPPPVDPTPLATFCAQNTMNTVNTMNYPELPGTNFPKLPGSLKCAPIPVPYTLDLAGNQVPLSTNIVKNKNTLIALGKMLFWDSQVGSDGLACASCHFQAGADNRKKNQIDPGLRNVSGKFARDGVTPIGNVFDFVASNPNTNKSLDPKLSYSGKGPNYTLKKSDFPLRQYEEPVNTFGQLPQSDRKAKIIYDSDDVISSQGAFRSTFKKLDINNTHEDCKTSFPISGPQMPLFNVAGNSVRQVATRNTPTVINAVYNFRNFWDGRANNVFNGLDPFGMRRFTGPNPPSAEIYVKGPTGKLVKDRIAIFNASLASQAVGPALSDMEMSCAGKQFPDLGRKMLSLKPLGKQKVDVSDSVLGSYTTSAGDIKPINTYKLLIQGAFNDKYWNVPDKQKVGGYNLMENNFSMFWGLAIQAYESTLVSDDSKYDQSVKGGDNLTTQEQSGLNIFLTKGKCVTCHMGAEFTSASTTNVANVQNASGFGKYIERMLMGDGGIALYDSGFYNIGVRPTDEDQGLGANDAYGFPLSFTRNAKKHTNDISTYYVYAEPNISSLSPDPFETNSFLYAGNIGCINWNPDTSWYGLLCDINPVIKDERDSVDGAFKTSSLRNVELTGPYFHNGGQATLEQVIEFYNRGGDRKDFFQIDPTCGGPLMNLDMYGNSVIAGDPITGIVDDSTFVSSGYGNNSNIATDIAGMERLITACDPTQPPQESLNLTNSDVSDLVAFMKTLTDERVRYEKAPFDHPSLVLPNGQVGNEKIVVSNPAVDQVIVLPAVGSAGRKPKGLRPLKSFETGLE